MNPITKVCGLINRTVEKYGYSFRFFILKEKKKYGPVGINSNYTPWYVDKEFQKLYNTIKTHTLIDIYQCYELWELVKESAKLKTGAYIEIGVWRGGSAGIITRTLKDLKVKETVYLCDTFVGVVKADETKDSTFVGGEHSDTSEKIVNNLLKKKLKVSNYKLLKGIFPEETEKLIPKKEKFRYCHVDVDTYQSAKDIHEWIWDKMVIGGMIIHDDYGFVRCDGITRLVDEERLKDDRLVIFNTNGHAIIIKIK